MGQKPSCILLHSKCNIIVLHYFLLLEADWSLIVIPKMPSTVYLILKILKFKYKLGMELLIENKEKEQLTMLKIGIKGVDFNQNSIG